MKDKDTKILEEAYENIHEGVGNFSVIKTGQLREPGDYPGKTTFKYDVLYKGKKAGELETNDYVGYIHGHLFNKKLPELSIYGREAGINSGVLGNLHAFLKSKTGQKWMSNINKNI